MRIKEVEKLTGITSRNIRFYEKEGLLQPVRNSENRYREYSDEDVRRLKEIKLLRKFDIGLADIKSMQDGSLALDECLKMYMSFFERQKEELEQTIALCALIQKNETDLQKMDADFYLDKINAAERDGVRFADIAKDFINKAKGIIPTHANLFFEPDEPIMNQFDFARELELYAERKGKSLMFIEMGMRPKVRLDDTIYTCALEMPRMLHFPLSIFFVYHYNLGYRWVYLYEDTTYVWYTQIPLKQ